MLKFAYEKYSIMTKSEIIDAIIRETNIDRQDATAVVEAFMKEVRTALINKENVYLRGFGSFVIRRRAEKTARNIIKNISIKVPAHDVVKYVPAPKFAKLVR